MQYPPVVADPEHRLRLEAFIADCAARFVGPQLPDDVGHEIEKALRELLAILGADRIALVGSAPEAAVEWTTCGAVSAGIDPTMRGQSTLTTRAAHGPSGVHELVIESVREPRAWPPEFVPRLALLAQVFVDALARKRADDTRDQLESRRDFLESVGAILWRADARTFQTTFVSKGAEALLGYPLESWEKVPGFWLDHIHPDDRAWVQAFTGRAVKERRHHDFEYRMVVADGRTVWLRNIVKVRLRDGDPVEIVGVTVDISERKRAEFEAAQLRNQLTHAGRVTSLGELAATLAHELNQPLGAMVSNAEAALMFLNRVPPALDRVRTILDDIARDGQRAGEVVHRVRMLLQNQPLECRPVDAAQTVHAVAGLVRALAQARHTTLAIEIEAGLPPVSGDAVQIQQVLFNLLLNAIDASGDRPPDARHVVVRAAGRGSDVELSVTDTGRGFPAAALPQVFDPFFTTKPGGMGMGLAICRTIVQAHGGRIEVGNNAGGGACVRVMLPACVSEGMDA